MKTEKLFKSLFSSGSSSKTAAITALIGGLAAGAVLGILLAPNSGKAARQKISDSLAGLFGDKSKACQTDSEVSFQTHSHQPGSRPKSDIKELVHQAHAASSQAEESLIK